jgi:hypothetical protein
MCTACNGFYISCNDGLMTVWWPKLVANKVNNKILLCLTEYNIHLLLSFNRGQHCAAHDLPVYRLAEWKVKFTAVWEETECWVLDIGVYEELAGCIFRYNNNSIGHLTFTAPRRLLNNTYCSWLTNCKPRWEYVNFWRRLVRKTTAGNYTERQPVAAGQESL